MKTKQLALLAGSLLSVAGPLAANETALLVNRSGYRMIITPIRHALTPTFTAMGMNVAGTLPNGSTYCSFQRSTNGARVNDTLELPSNQALLFTSLHTEASKVDVPLRIECKRRNGDGMHTFHVVFTSDKRGAKPVERLTLMAQAQVSERMPFHVVQVQAETGPHWMGLEPRSLPEVMAMDTGEPDPLACAPENATSPKGCCAIQ